MSAEYVIAGNIHSLVSGEAGSLSLKVTDMPLVNVLNDISTRTGIRVYGDSSLAGERVTAEFQNLTVE
ncbi:MAG: hypothetical protein PH343_05140 [Nitrospira sp.]|nr:hypothetical protein [Nitrospira sp.]